MPEEVDFLCKSKMILWSSRIILVSKKFSVLLMLFSRVKFNLSRKELKIFEISPKCELCAARRMSSIYL